MNIEEIIKVPYTTRPHMTRNDGEAFGKRPRDSVIREKQAMLSFYGEDLFGQTSDCLSEGIVARVSKHLGFNETDSIVQLALNLEEDVAILHRGVLHAICFCFPSSWKPSTGLNKTLMQLHEPVADGNHLRDASERIAKTISDPTLGGFRRYVWTINRVGRRCNHPTTVEHNNKFVPIAMENLYFRTETQTTLPMPHGSTAVFFVKVEVVPLESVWRDHSELILKSINTMSDTVLTYKNLHQVKDYLNNASLVHR